MALDIYNMIVEVVGVLPNELQFVYGFLTIFMFMILILCVSMPFILIYKWGGR
ncbi:MAG: hypothetical protein PHF21_04520 [Bacilli bacterium]|nr:hypothetical protein [Bacilli bacterium]